MFKNIILIILSWLLAAFGQPAWVPWLGLIASIAGYAIFWKGMLQWRKGIHRFIIATAWFSTVQAVSLSWMTSTTYTGSFILLAYAILSIGMGLQFGITSIFVSRRYAIFVVPALWTLMEWSRLFLLCGLSFGPAGIALTSHVLPMQLTSVFGIYGLSFLVMLTNIVALKAWERKTLPLLLAIVSLATMPYIYGLVHIALHDKPSKETASVLLVQTALYPEEKTGFNENRDAYIPIFEQWLKILQLLQPHLNDDIDFIVFPENTVPLPAYSPAYHYPAARAAFAQILGEDSLDMLPAIKPPLATTSNNFTAVNNAFWSQAIATIFDATVIIGLEDNDDDGNAYASAFVFKPDASYVAERYDKHILVPIAEYIPFHWARKLAANYGIFGSFTPGNGPNVFANEKTPFSISICYEETFGNLIRKNKLLDTKLLINITNDAWYPNSRLPQQHFHLAKTRTVENGIPLARACNTGITCTVDSFGRVLETCSSDEWQSGTLKTTIPLQWYKTLYSRYGDWTIISISILLLLTIALLKSTSFE